MDVRLLLTIFKCFVKATWKAKLSMVLAVLLLKEAIILHASAPYLEQLNIIWS